MADQYDALAILRALQEAKTKRQIQKVLCVWLRIALSLRTEQIAVATGLSPASVRRIQRIAKLDVRYLLQEKRGGRHREHISLAREKQIMSKFLYKAQRGHALNVPEIRKAYEISVGKQVA